MLSARSFLCMFVCGEQLYVCILVTSVFLFIMMSVVFVLMKQIKI